MLAPTLVLVIFLHHSAVEKLQHSAGVSCKECSKQGTIELTQEAFFAL